MLLKIASSRRVDGGSEGASGDIRLQVCGSQQLYVIWPINRFPAFFPPPPPRRILPGRALCRNTCVHRGEQDSQPVWRTVSGVFDTRRSAVSDRGAFQQICRPSNAPPRAPTSFGTRRTRRKPVRREARAHSYLFPLAPLTWCSLFLSIFRPSVRRVVAGFCAGMIKAALPPSSCSAAS